MPKLEFKNGIVEEYTIVLSTRDKRKLGQISGITNMRFKGALNSASEFSFSVSKHDMLLFNGNTDYDLQRYRKIKTAIWNQIVDLKLIWVKELNKYYEIKVKLDDSSDAIVKNITATHLCEAELSQLLLENVEINTEKDIERDDYEITIFYDRTNPNASMLDRILKDKAPHYTIKHVDDSLMKLQRSFSINGTNIYDFLTGECAEQFNCLFIFDSADRSISVYDLYAVCQECGHRFEDYNECPNCGSSNIKYFGQDTTILVDKNNLTESVELEVDADSIKNSFKMVAGDDLMTATVRLLNQNGSDYIYYFSDRQREDMPTELVEKIDSYDVLYDSYKDEYRKLIEGTFDENGEVIDKGIYQLTDDILYLTSGKMPTIEQAEITAETEAAQLTKEHLSPVALTNVTPATSSATVDSAIKNYAKVYVKSGYVKIDIADGSTFTYTKEEDGIHYGLWSGTIIVTNYSDKEDVQNVSLTDIEVHDNYADFIKQKVLKQLASSDDENSVFDVLAIDDLDKFKEALTLYCLNRLTSFYDAIQGALDVLVQLGQGETDAFLYEDLYKVYYDKLQLCQAEIDVRKQEIDEVQTQLDAKEEHRYEIQKALDFKAYLGDYYNIFCAYRREDIYSNDNYISDGLSNSELIQRANEFIDTAKKELYKSGEKQINISSTLYNLLLMKEFQPLLKYFELGNWIRVKVDGEIYRLRLLSYEINFSSIQTINVEFSTVSKIKDLTLEAEQIHKNVQSISSSYQYVSKQAEQGNKANTQMQDWINNGLSNSLIQIMNNTNQEVTYGKHGLLGRAYDDITNTYSPKQVRLTNNALVFTEDGWETVRQAIGEHSYVKYNKETNTWEEYIGYGITADFFTGGHISGGTMVGGEIYSTNYSNDNGKETGTYFNLNEGILSIGGDEGLKYSKDTGLRIASTAIEEAVSDLDIVAETLGVKAENIHGNINSSQIENIDATKIVGTITASQIEEGTIKAGSINASGIEGEIQSDQIAFINIDKINGQIPSSNIDDTLTNKTITGSFSGDIEVKSVKTTNNTTTYTGLTNEYTIGNNKFKFVNGILVSVTNIT